jgi:hypothetical protein
MDHSQNIQRLTPEEREVLERFKDEKGKPSISVALSLKMFELYLNGSTCEEIVKVNNNQFSLGQVLEVRVRDGWDEKKDRYLADLYGGIVDKVRQTQMESVGFTADLLAVAHKQFGHKLKRYLQTGDEKELGPLSLNGLLQYQKAVDILMKLTGQDKKEAASKLQIPAAQVTPVGPIPTAPQAGGKLLPGGTESLDSSLAEKVLQFLNTQEDENE